MAFNIWALCKVMMFTGLYCIIYPEKSGRILRRMMFWKKKTYDEFEDEKLGVAERRAGKTKLGGFILILFSVLVEVTIVLIYTY